MKPAFIVGGFNRSSYFPPPKIHESIDSEIEPLSYIVHRHIWDIITFMARETIPCFIILDLEDFNEAS